MMEGWTKGYLSDLIIFQRGFDITKANQRIGTVPVISSSGINSYHDEFKSLGPGIIIGRKGTLGSVHFCAEPYWPHDTTLWSKKIYGEIRFIYYLLKVLNLGHYDVGNANPTLNRNHIHKLKINIPPRSTQSRIASILSAYDDLIENNQKRIKLLEEQAQQTYEEWFVRFKFPGYEKAVFDEESGLPVGWGKIPLKEMAEMKFGYAFKANQFNSDGLGKPIIRIRNIPSSQTKDFTTEIVDDKYIVEKGDLLIGMDGEFYVNNWSGPESYLVQRVCNLRAKKEIYKGLLTEAIKHPIKIFQASIDGATVAHLGKKHLDQIEILIPYNIDVSIFTYLLNQKINLSSQNQLLKEARDILLPRLMTGMIDVESLEANEGLKMAAEVLVDYNIN